MSNEHSHHAGKDTLEAMKENDAHTLGQSDAVPGGAHAHSPAAHESGPHAHTHPAENERQLITELEQRNHRLDRGRDNNRGAGAGLKGNG